MVEMIDDAAAGGDAVVGITLPEQNNDQATKTTSSTNSVPTSAVPTMMDIGSGPQAAAVGIREIAANEDWTWTPAPRVVGGETVLQTTYKNLATNLRPQRHSNKRLVQRVLEDNYSIRPAPHVPDMMSLAHPSRLIRKACTNPES